MGQVYTQEKEFPDILNEMLNCNSQWQPLNRNKNRSIPYRNRDHTITLEEVPATEHQHWQCLAQWWHMGSLLSSVMIALLCMAVVHYITWVV